jgi:hypothetical protein
MLRAAPVFSAQTATGQPYYSDSRMLFLELNPEVTRLAGTTEVADRLR